jgi:hypothetical protein
MRRLLPCVPCLALLAACGGSAGGGGQGGGGSSSGGSSGGASSGSSSSSGGIATIPGTCGEPDPSGAGGATYWLDAKTGQDDNDGTASHPWKTFKKALGSVHSRDTVLMNDGDYGVLIAGRTKDENLNYGASIDDVAQPRDEFTDWVTFKAAPGQAPHATRLDLGTLNTDAFGGPNHLVVQLDYHVKGNADAYLRFEGITFDDGVEIRGSRHVQLVNCAIHRAGPLNGSVAAIDDNHGLFVLNGRYVTLRGNDITHCAIGLWAASYDLGVCGNEIHRNSHDGIRLLGGADVVIEGNRIHDLDDGVDDADDTRDPAIPGSSWNRHSDGMHIVEERWGTVSNLVVRRNLFYHLESMGIILFDPQHADGSGYSNVVLENNVFGPTGGYLLHLGAPVDGRFLFRHNTVVQAPNDVWTSIYPTNTATGLPRSMAGRNYQFMWPDCTGECSVYGNILASGNDSMAMAWAGAAPTSFTGHNLYASLSSAATALRRGERVWTRLPYESIAGNIDDHIAATGHLPGALTADSEAIDAGTRIGSDDATPLPDLLAADLLGTPRDLRPDLGAFEVAGRSPAAETYTFAADPAAPLHLVDDFTDGRIDLRDPLLNGPDTTGIAWVQPAGYEKFRTITKNARTYLTTVYDLAPGIAVTSKRVASAALSFAFDAYQPMSDCGVVFLYRGPDDHWFYDFAGRLVRRQGGAETVVATVAAAPASGRGALELSLSGATVQLTMRVDGVTLWSWSGATPFPDGAVGFYRKRTSGNGYDTVDYDDVRLDLATASDLVGDL